MAENIIWNEGRLQRQNGEAVAIASLGDEEGLVAGLVSVPAEPDEIEPVPATAATSSTPFGFSEVQANAIVTQLNNVIDILIAAGLGAEVAP